MRRLARAFLAAALTAGAFVSVTPHAWAATATPAPTDGARSDVYAFGSAHYAGANHGALAAEVVGITPTRSGRGYWLAARDGGVFSFGDARFHGSTGSIRLNRPIVGMAATPSGKGYWLVAADGGIFTFGDARFHGSTGARHLNQPIVGMAATRSGRGYWLVAADGGIFSYGDAQYHGGLGQSAGAKGRTFGMARAGARGYWLASQR